MDLRRATFEIVATVVAGLMMGTCALLYVYSHEPAARWVWQLCRCTLP
jgi:hypothetical protein